MVVLASLDKNGGCVAIDYQPEAHTLTPHMFPCHRSHPWIFGGGHFMAKNPLVLAFVLWKMGVFLVDDQWPHNPIFVENSMNGHFQKYQRLTPTDF
jgi:hypothetical protein